MRMLSTIRALTLLLLAVAAISHAEVKRFTILHVNDLHARLLPDEQGRGGFAHVATALESLRRNSKNPIVLHAGDMVQGSPVSTIFEGTPVFEVANSLGIDAHCLGNHEFDYGWERIADFVRVSNAPLLAANVINDRGERLAPPSVVLEAGNLKIGVIGALTTRLRQLVKPGQIGPWRVTPLVDSLRVVVSEMHEQADLVVVLAHLFDDEDELVLRGLPDVDVLVGGHNHGGRQTELIVDGRIGVKLRPYGRELGRLEIAFDTESERVVDHLWTRIPGSPESLRSVPGDSGASREMGIQGVRARGHRYWTIRASVGPIIRQGARRASDLGLDRGGPSLHESGRCPRLAQSRDCHRATYLEHPAL